MHTNTILQIAESFESRAEEEMRRSSLDDEAATNARTLRKLARREREKAAKIK